MGDIVSLEDAPRCKKTVAEDGLWIVYERDIDAALAQRAGEVALMLRANPGHPAVEVLDDQGGYWRVGIHDPRGLDDVTTVFGDTELFEDTAPLRDMAGEMLALFPDMGECSYAYFLLWQAGVGVDVHADRQNRIVAGLIGRALVGLEDTYSQEWWQFEQRPGDAYRLYLDQKSGETALHGVDPSDSDRLVMMLIDDSDTPRTFRIVG